MNTAKAKMFLKKNKDLIVGTSLLAVSAVGAVVLVNLTAKLIDQNSVSTVDLFTFEDGHQGINVYLKNGTVLPFHRAK